MKPKQHDGARAHKSFTKDKKRFFFADYLVERNNVTL